ncbi:hypothetical protein GCM10010969_00010 [Saccharibacillus kuerlensis]|uniref:Uncharacterized protein n=1 Tax=Saccharibacillus kuerlensis TaxID=459527 RepID=A0ABQ2KRD1_9BACL|nr:hypothetical protein GCM10010969_00010 [Saccharibacillus kuerlensis]
MNKLDTSMMANSNLSEQKIKKACNMKMSMVIYKPSRQTAARLFVRRAVELGTGINEFVL